ncbi:hypothetical protein MPH_01907 [Macrophomina phaseolina MS6]|uniref:Uncharacterized protein n=1 Tax=Macrophomina phaseolina (strain MS6) TaxID=1126212 RepID=K2SVV7_MACPH|nr:hypothetical protein MPH_01907 [Macrophomina phaseolina MS6]
MTPPPHHAVFAGLHQSLLMLNDPGCHRRRRISSESVFPTRPLSPVSNYPMERKKRSFCVSSIVSRCPVSCYRGAINEMNLGQTLILYRSGVYFGSARGNSFDYRDSQAQDVCREKRHSDSEKSYRQEILFGKMLCVSMYALLYE